MRGAQGQLGFESILAHGAGRLMYLAGYSWTMPPGVLPWVHGVVCTGRWVDRAVREFTAPIMLDNGAFPAWRDGVELSGQEQLDGLAAAIRKHSDRIDWVVVPDIVAAGPRSWGLTEWATPKVRMLTERATLMLPVQDGQDLARCVEFADRNDAALFVGGSTYEWKRYAAREIRGLGFKGHLHVARIWRDGDLFAHSNLADTFDNTTYCRAQHFNRRIGFDQLADRYLVAS